MKLWNVFFALCIVMGVSTSAYSQQPVSSEAPPSLHLSSPTDPGKREAYEAALKKPRLTDAEMKHCILAVQDLDHEKVRLLKEKESFTKTERAIGDKGTAINADLDAIDAELANYNKAVIRHQ